MADGQVIIQDNGGKVPPQKNLKLEIRKEQPAGTKKKMDQLKLGQPHPIPGEKISSVAVTGMGAPAPAHPKNNVTVYGTECADGACSGGTKTVTLTVANRSKDIFVTPNDALPEANGPIYQTVNGSIIDSVSVDDKPYYSRPLAFTGAIIVKIIYEPS